VVFLTLAILMNWAPVKPPLGELGLAHTEWPVEGLGQLRRGLKRGPDLFSAFVE